MFPVEPSICFPGGPMSPGISEPTQPRAQTLIEKVQSMQYDKLAQALAREDGLSIQSVTWEDCGRTKGSCWGPNISDMTLQVKGDDGEYHAMPVIRQPNFEDKTHDVPLDTFQIKVGNESGAPTLTRMTLRQFLENIGNYVKDGTIKGPMLAERDTHVIHSVQACFLPAEDGKEVNFNVSLYNYQSTAEHPAVLTVVVSAHGTSTQVVGSTKYDSQKLMFNKNGKACDFGAERLKDVRANAGAVVEGAMNDQEDENRRLYIIQIPLKIPPRPVRPFSGGYECMAMCAMPAAASGVMMKSAGMDHAQLKIGKEMGDFNGLNKLTIERDPAYPIRVTEQLYKIVSSGDINREEMKAVANDIKASEQKGINGSSLVLENTNRPTEWVKV